MNIDGSITIIMICWLHTIIYVIVVVDDIIMWYHWNDTMIAQCYVPKP